MPHFAIVSKYADAGLTLPTRATSKSCGYDLAAAADITIPPYQFCFDKLANVCYETDRVTDYYGFLQPLTLDEVSSFTKQLKTKPTLVPTGIKCYLEDNQWLQLTARSSIASKDWLMLANSVGTIDADYVDNPDNEGEIFVPLINLSPFAIQIKKGDRLVNAIIQEYKTTDDDSAEGERQGGFGSTNE